MRAHLISAPLGLACIFTLSLAACVSGSTDGSSGPGGVTAGTTNTFAGTSAGGATAGGAIATGGTMPGAGTSAGGNFMNQAGSGAGTPGAGAGGTVGMGGVGGNGQGGTPAGAPQGVTITTHDLSVTGGKVFNVADDYFNDGFIPPTPVANFGCQSQITVHQNDDGSLDVGWLDYTGGAGKPWAVPTPAMINVTHIDAGLTTASTTPTGINSYKLLGFDKDPAGNAYVAYNKDHALKTSTPGDENNINGNELHVAKVGGWDTLVFGNQNNNDDGTPGDPGGAASGVLGYDAMNQKIMIYLGHSMMWTPIRHQAGFLRLIDPSSGAVINPAGNDVLHFGAGWWYSHNFNQRMIIDGGNYYMLAHGDAYSRTLGFARWSVSGYTGKNDTDFNESYFDIAGNEGDNNTNAQTGQFVRISPDQFAIVHTTSQDRAARDVRLVAVSGSNGKADGAKAVWLTTNQGTVQATMPKLEMLGDKILVTYALWDSSKKHALTWYATLLDSTFATVTQPEVLQNVEFVDSAPLFRFKGGPNAGQVGWVSGNASHTLSVHVASVRY